MSTLPQKAPGSLSQAYQLLELVAISGELPASQLSRLAGGISYKESVVKSLKRQRLLLSYYKNGLRGYRLTAAAKKLLLVRDPERFSFYLSGACATNHIRSEPEQRLRLHRVSQTLITMRNAGISIFRDEKPGVFRPGEPAIGVICVPAFYTSREIKEMGTAFVKIRGARSVGVLLTPRHIHVAYNLGNTMMKWSYKAEMRTKALMQTVLCRERIPSFAATSSRWCDTIELTKDTSGNYSASVTDTNGVLSDFNFGANSGNGITFSQRGNTLTITATPEAAKGLASEKTYSATGSAYGIDPDEAVLCWYDSTGKYQSLASYTGTGLDPVRAYIKIKATVTEDKGSLTINKTDADTGKALAGVTYRLFDSAGNKIADAATGTDGKAVFSDLPLGSYTYQEISAPEGYVMDSTKYPITITASALNITATRTNALGKASVEISKVDEDSNTPLQGAGFRLYDAAGSQVAEGYTDANGKLTFTDLKLGSYTCKEFQAPAGYELDETAFPITLNQNGQILRVTRENKLITGSIEILKVDADTKKPLAGVVYRLFDADGNKIADGTTDANGKLTFDNLKPGSYSYQEISTVDGYQLDDTKYDFSLTSENLTIKVTRENKPVRGCLTVRKVDVTGSPLAGAELMLETSTDGQDWTEVSRITTDKTGIAKWDDLKIGTQFRITEVKAPAGYTLLAEPLFTGTLDSSNPDVTLTACNSAGFVLPFTGSAGFAPYILFAALALMAGVYFCKKSARHEMAG